MTGSGKSELLISWLLSIACNYHPEDVSFVVIDYKGGSTATSLEKLPHVCGIITDVGSGIELFVREGYRTTQDQKDIMNERIQQYQNEGYSRGEAKKLAKEYVAEPGTSEHELGIAVDINADTSKCSSDAVYTWLANNAYKYGFIKRLSLIHI